MNKLLNKIKNNKVKLVIAVIAAMGVSTTVHAWGCTGPFDIMRDMNGYFYHQHYAINAWGQKVATYFHY